MELGVNAVMLPELDFPEQIELCRKLGVHYYQYRPRHIPAERRKEPFSYWGNHAFDLTPQRLLTEGAKLTAQLRSAGLEPWGTAPALNVDAPDDLIRLHVDAAVAAGCRCIRCNPSPYPGTIFDYDAFLGRTVERYGQIADRIAAPSGIKLIIETHSQSLASSPSLAWNICRHFDPERVGIILDLANFHREGEIRPNLALSILKKHIDCVHIGGSRRVRSGVDAFGCEQVAFEFCALELADSPIPNWIKALREADVNVPLIIEDYEPNLPSQQRLGRCVALLRRILAAEP